MGVIEKTDRPPDYYNDIKFYGNFAENDFLQMLRNNTKDNGTLFDVRTNKEYQYVDIDFVIDKDGGNELPNSINDVLLNKNYQKIEVKYNSRALDTGWIAYESISHYSLGWGETTKCDLMYMVLTEKNSLNIQKRCWIYMDKWKQYLADRKNTKKINFIKNEGVVDLLCNVNDMVSKGVLKFI